MVFLRNLTIIIAIFSTLVLALGITGARFNTTRSIPLGLYWVSPERIQKGKYVMFCPPQAQVFDDAKERGYLSAGYCPGGYGYLMKKIVGVPGDTVQIEHRGVSVNDKILPLSRVRITDNEMRPLPQLRIARRLRMREFLLMSDINEDSFDSRYFGPINRSQIVTVIKPILTWS
jgi:conjugative transfer signal peptidase TraF